MTLKHVESGIPVLSEISVMKSGLSLSKKASNTAISLDRLPVFFFVIYLTLTDTEA